MLNFNHLKTASQFANKQDKLWIYQYVWHFFLAIRESLFLFVLAIFSLIHAVLPFVFDFKLIEWRIQELARLKKSLPNDPHLKKIKIED